MFVCVSSAAEGRPGPRFKMGNGPRRSWRFRGLRALALILILLLVQNSSCHSKDAPIKTTDPRPRHDGGHNKGDTPIPREIPSPQKQKSPSADSVEEAKRILGIQEVHLNHKTPIRNVEKILPQKEEISVKKNIKGSRIIFAEDVLASKRVLSLDEADAGTDAIKIVEENPTKTSNVRSAIDDVSVSTVKAQVKNKEKENEELVEKEEVKDQPTKVKFISGSEHSTENEGNDLSLVTEEKVIPPHNDKNTDKEEDKGTKTEIKEDQSRGKESHEQKQKDKTDDSKHLPEKVYKYVYVGDDDEVAEVRESTSVVDGDIMHDSTESVVNVVQELEKGSPDLRVASDSSVGSENMKKDGEKDAKEESDDEKESKVKREADNFKSVSDKDEMKLEKEKLKKPAAEKAVKKPAAEKAMKKPAEEMTEKPAEEKPKEATEEMKESLPPVSGGLEVEKEVLNAIEARSNSVVNVTINPARVLDDGVQNVHRKILAEEGDGKLTHILDAKEFFNSISAKNFTHINNGRTIQVVEEELGERGVEGKRHSHERRLKEERSSDVLIKLVGGGEEEEGVNEGGKAEKPVREVKKESKDVSRGGLAQKSVSALTDGRGTQERREEGQEDSITTDKEPAEKSNKLEEKVETADTQKEEEAKSEKRKEQQKEGTSSKSDKEEKGKELETEKAVAKEEKSTEVKESNDSSEPEEAKKTEPPPHKQESSDEAKAKESKKETSEAVEELKEDTERKKEEEKPKDHKEDAKKQEGKEVEDKKPKEPEASKDTEEEKEEKIVTNVTKTETEKTKKKQTEPAKIKKTKEGAEEGKADRKEEEKSPDTLETYSQFTQRVNAEKKNDVNANGHSGNGHKGPKVKSKNYASPDCGSKLMSANPEATHASKVIQSNRDEYMLNKCRDKIWFIIELCESIRPQKFDIANFELFSNLPKEIQVSGSHRYPSRDWSSLGRFTAQEGNRGVQSFHVDTEDFYKYVKVEVLSHYGSEFFCPISLFRIYGLSEFEVIDTIEDASEDSDDSEETFSEAVEEEHSSKKHKDEGKPSVIPAVLKNMFTGVLDVIKRGYRPSSISTEPDEKCYSLHPKFAMESGMCSMAGTLNYILSCYKMEYESLMQQPFVSSTVKNSSFCRRLASVMCAEPEVNDSIVYDTVCNNSYVCVMLSPKHVLAMCFMQDPRIVDNQASCGPSDSQLPENFSTTSSDILSNTNQMPSYVKNAVINTSSITRADATEANISKASEVHGLKLSEKGDDTPTPVKQDTDKTEETTLPASPESGAIQHPKTPKEAKPSEKTGQEKAVKEAEADSSVGEPLENLEVEGSGFGEMNLEEEEFPPTEELATVAPPPPSSVPPPVESKPLASSPTNKESIVVRLSNKIKALEYNMSISSQYLEELSRRYKRQMEEMQKQFNLTIAALNATSRQAYERDQEHQRDIKSLEEQLDNVSSILEKLVEERETLAHTVVEQHLLLMVVEVVVLCVVFTVCHRRRLADFRVENGASNERRAQTPSEDSAGQSEHESRHCSLDDLNPSRVRRRSVDSITRERASRPRRRRPSEEALNISGTYQDLLIIEPAIPILMDSMIDYKKKRKSSSGTLKRSKSNASIVENSSFSSRRAKRIEKLNMSSAGVLFCGDKSESCPTPNTPLSSPDSPDSSSIPYEPFYNEQDGILYESMEGGNSCIPRAFISELEPGGTVLSDVDSPTSKRHSLPCASCDTQQKKTGKMSKSTSLCNPSESGKSGKEKVKKVKKVKKMRDNNIESRYCNSYVVDRDRHNDHNDVFPMANGTTCKFSGHEDNEYYYNGHSSVHFSEDTKINGDDSHVYNYKLDSVYGDGYTNGIDSHPPLYTDKNFMYTDHDRLHTTERQNVLPKAKTKVKLRSDNWEWYSSQHLGGSSSETVSTCSDSSGKSRKQRREEGKPTADVVEVEKKPKKKRSKTKSPALTKEDVIPERDPGT